jgi:hypothetical protein
MTTGRSCRRRACRALLSTRNRISASGRRGDSVGGRREAPCVPSVAAGQAEARPPRERSRKARGGNPPKRHCPHAVGAHPGGAGRRARRRCSRRDGCNPSTTPTPRWSRSPATATATPATASPHATRSGTSPKGVIAGHDTVYAIDQRSSRRRCRSTPLGTASHMGCAFGTDACHPSDDRADITLASFESRASWDGPRASSDESTVGTSGVWRFSIRCSWDTLFAHGVSRMATVDSNDLSFVVEIDRTNRTRRRGEQRQPSAAVEHPHRLHVGRTA